MRQRMISYPRVARVRTAAALPIAILLAVVSIRPAAAGWNAVSSDATPASFPRSAETRLTLLTGVLGAIEDNNALGGDKLGPLVQLGLELPVGAQFGLDAYAGFRMVQGQQGQASILPAVGPAAGALFGDAQIVRSRVQAWNAGVGLRRTVVGARHETYASVGAGIVYARTKLSDAVNVPLDFVGDRSRVSDQFHDLAPEVQFMAGWNLRVSGNSVVGLTAGYRHAFLSEATNLSGLVLGVKLGRSL
jgi:hypothetical protein